MNVSRGLQKAAAAVPSPAKCDSPSSPTAYKRTSKSDSRRAAAGKKVLSARPVFTDDELCVRARADNRVITVVTPEQRLVLNSCGDDDPAIVFDWHGTVLQSLAAFFFPAPPAPAPNVPPAWMGMPPPGGATVEWLQTAILRHATAIAAGACCHSQG